MRPRSAPLLAAMLAVVAPGGVRQLAAQVRMLDFTGQPTASVDTPLVNVGSARGLPGGRALVVVWIAERQQAILLADFPHRTVRSISRVGAGPGEFRSVGRPMVAANSSTRLMDVTLRRILLVSSDGKATTEALPTQGAITFPTVIDVRGRYYDTHAPLARGGGPPPDSLPVRCWDLATNRFDTLAWMPFSKTLVRYSKVMPGNLHMDFIGPPAFTPATLWGVLDDGRAVLVHPDPYRVDVADAAGKFHVGVPIPFQPIKVTTAERDSIRKDHGEAAEEVGATKPPFENSTAVVISPENEVWVERSRARGDLVPQYDVFNDQGRLIATARLRPNSRIIGFGPGAVFVARQSPDDDFWHLEMYARK